jgi:hypothetical protein
MSGGKTHAVSLSTMSSSRMRLSPGGANGFSDIFGNCFIILLLIIMEQTMNSIGVLKVLAGRRPMNIIIALWEMVTHGLK